MGELNKQFENDFPIPAHWIEFDEKRNKYYCPYVADAKAQEYQAKWEVWQFQQSKIEQLERINAKNKNTLQHLECEYLRVIAENKALRGECE